jgi:hypothetical protein
VFAEGQLEVTADVATGFVVVHEMLTLQLLAPDAIVHDKADEVSVPLIVGAWHTLPFHVVPEAQLDDTVVFASSCALL